MSQPIIANNRPAKVMLEKNKKYFFCSCGRSANQPFCDGSHKGSSFTPHPFKVEEDGDRYLCACKHTATAPFCDGTHKSFTAEQVGTDGSDI